MRHQPVPMRCCGASRQADMDRRDGNLRFAPITSLRAAAKSALFDHLIGGGDERLRHGEAEPGSLGVGSAFRRPAEK